MHHVFIWFTNATSKLPNIFGFLAAIGLLLGLSACSATPVHEAATLPGLPVNQLPIRFLLTFDDGPVATKENSPTQSILDDLANNPLQPGIKAIFFLQTRAGDAGGAALGSEFMQREYSAGHVLGFHTATSGHDNHRYLSPEVFTQSLNDGIADIRAVTGSAPSLVRPPFWSYDQRTVAEYQRHGLHMVLTDLSANDGKIWGVNFSLRRRSSMLRQLAEVREQIALGALPAVDGSIPVIVTFHDINRYTARHMQEYLQILADSARELNMPTAAKPFYDDRAALERAAIARSVSDASQKVRLPGLWSWIWN